MTTERMRHSTLTSFGIKLCKLALMSCQFKDINIRDCVHKQCRVERERERESVCVCVCVVMSMCDRVWSVLWAVSRGLCDCFMLCATC